MENKYYRKCLKENYESMPHFDSQLKAMVG